MTEEFTEVYLKYSDKIFRFLYWHCQDIQKAEDLTSEVFFRAFKKWQEFKDEYPQAWLYRIARNLLIDSYRSKRSLSSLEEALEISIDEDLIENLEKNEEVQKLKLALGKLPENLRQVIILRFFEDLSSAEVGSILGIAEGNVRVLQYRGLQKLKEELE